MIEKLRKVCLALPGATEESMHSHPCFRIAGKTFCIYHGEPGKHAVALKVGKALLDTFLKDARFFKTPYIGHQGWISFLETQKMPAAELEHLTRASYQLAAPAPRKKKKK